MKDIINNEKDEPIKTDEVYKKYDIIFPVKKKKKFTKKPLTFDVNEKEKELPKEINNIEEFKLDDNKQNDNKSNGNKEIIIEKKLKN